MGTKKNDSQDLMALALKQTTSNIVKGRGTSGRKTYLDRFVSCLLDEDGQPTEPKKRTTVVAEMSLEICLDTRAAEQEKDAAIPDFVLTEEGDTADDKFFEKVNGKVKNQVAAAIANNNNATSVSYNDKYKDIWVVGKTGDKVFLIDKEANPEEAAEETE